MEVSKEESEKNKFNVYIPISIDSKFFNFYNIRSYISWALNHTKEEVLIIVKDGLHASKIEVIDKLRKERALSLSSKQGDAKINLIKDVIKTLPNYEQIRNIKIIRWKDVNTTSFYKSFRNAVYEEFNRNVLFYNFVLDLTRRKFNKHRKRIFDEHEVNMLSNYMLDKMATIRGVKYLNTFYNLTVYPNNYIAKTFKEKIQRKEILSDFYGKDNVDFKVIKLRVI